MYRYLRIGTLANECRKLNLLLMLTVEAITNVKIEAISNVTKNRYTCQRMSIMIIKSFEFQTVCREAVFAFHDRLF